MPAEAPSGLSAAPYLPDELGLTPGDAADQFGTPAGSAGDPLTTERSSAPIAGSLFEGLDGIRKSAEGSGHAGGGVCPYIAGAAGSCDDAWVPGGEEIRVVTETVRASAARLSGLSGALHEGNGHLATTSDAAAQTPAAAACAELVAAWTAVLSQTAAATDSLARAAGQAAQCYEQADAHAMPAELPRVGR